MGEDKEIKKKQNNNKRKEKRAMELHRGGNEVPAGHSCLEEKKKSCQKKGRVDHAEEGKRGRRFYACQERLWTRELEFAAKENVALRKMCKYRQKDEKHPPRTREKAAEFSEPTKHLKGGKEVDFKQNIFFPQKGGKTFLGKALRGGGEFARPA